MARSLSASPKAATSSRFTPRRSARVRRASRPCPRRPKRFPDMWAGKASAAAGEQAPPCSAAQFEQHLVSPRHRNLPRFGKSTRKRYAYGFLAAKADAVFIFVAHRCNALFDRKAPARGNTDQNAALFRHRAHGARRFHGDIRLKKRRAGRQSQASAPLKTMTGALHAAARQTGGRTNTCGRWRHKLRPGFHDALTPECTGESSLCSIEQVPSKSEAMRRIIGKTTPLMPLFYRILRRDARAQAPLSQKNPLPKIPALDGANPEMLQNRRG